MAGGSHLHSPERKVVMTNQLIRNLSVALLAAVSISAQGSQKITVQVPFAFHVGSSTLPSVEYTVDTDAEPGILRLRLVDSTLGVMIEWMSLQAPARSREG